MTLKEKKVVKRSYFYLTAVVVTNILALLAAYFVIQTSNRVESIYPQNNMERLYKEVMSSVAKTGEQPIVIVTGSTSGIGLELASELYRLGAKVIIASRSHSKCLKIIDEISSTHRNAAGSLEVGVLDTSDLDSVKAFITDFQSKYTYLNYLVNNAGIHYMSTENAPLMNISAPIVSKQGYDLSFATNYMGHFLLTDKLLPLMRNGRIVNIASSYHFQADGRTLTPPAPTDGLHDEPHEVTPSAGRIEPTFHHRRIAYGVSKLAQVLHAKELQRRLDNMIHPPHTHTDSYMKAKHTDTAKKDTVDDDTASQESAAFPSTDPEKVTTTTTAGRNVKAVAVCPGWVGTNILPPGPVGTMVRNNAFTGRASILAPMCALLDTSLKGGEFMVNFRIPLTQNPYYSPLMFKIATAMGMRDVLADFLGLLILAQQSGSYGCHVQRSSEESQDPELARSLYDWTLNELKIRGY